MMSLTLSRGCILCGRAALVNFNRISSNNHYGIKFQTGLISWRTTLNRNVFLTSSLQASSYEPSPPKAKKEAAQEEQWQKTPLLEPGKLPQYCLMLSKIRLTSLVVITSMAGYALAPAPFDPVTFALCAVGTGLVSGAANSINQFFEVPFDAQMSRTKNRVLVRGLLSPYHGVGFAALSATTGLSLLYFGVNGLTACLGAGNLILYTCVYTPLKRMSILNTWVGSIVGAIPPLMGWAACNGSLGMGAGILGLLLYSWQFPHFNALSWNLRPDYSRAGYRMMSVTNPALCRRVALRHTAIITAVCCAAPYMDVTNAWFALESLPLNVYFMYLAWQFNKKSDSNSSRKLFRFSLIHLPALMFLFLVNKKHWSSDTETSELGSKEIISSQGIKLSEKKFKAMLPRGPVVTAQDDLPIAIIDAAPSVH